MISYDMIIAELEKQLLHAKQSQTDQQKREVLTAMKALCDVALQSKGSAPIQSQFVQPTMMTAAPVSPTMQQSAAVVLPNQVNKLQEEDANGDSLFDF